MDWVFLRDGDGSGSDSDDGSSVRVSGGNDDSASEDGSDSGFAIVRARKDRRSSPAVDGVASASLATVAAAAVAVPQPTPPGFFKVVSYGEAFSASSSSSSSTDGGREHSEFPDETTIREPIFGAGIDGGGTVTHEEDSESEVCGHVGTGSSAEAPPASSSSEAAAPTVTSPLPSFLEAAVSPCKALLVPEVASDMEEGDAESFGEEEERDAECCGGEEEEEYEDAENSGGEEEYTETSGKEEEESYAKEEEYTETSGEEDDETSGDEEEDDAETSKDKEEETFRQEEDSEISGDDDEEEEEDDGDDTSGDEEEDDTETSADVEDGEEETFRQEEDNKISGDDYEEDDDDETSGDEEEDDTGSSANEDDGEEETFRQEEDNEISSDDYEEDEDDETSGDEEEDDTETSADEEDGEEETFMQEEDNEIYGDDDEEEHDDDDETSGDEEQDDTSADEQEEETFSEEKVDIETSRDDHESSGEEEEEKEEADTSSEEEDSDDDESSGEEDADTSSGEEESDDDECSSEYFFEIPATRHSTAPRRTPYDDVDDSDEEDDDRHGYIDITPMVRTYNAEQGRFPTELLGPRPRVYDDIDTETDNEGSDVEESSSSEEGCADGDDAEENDWLEFFGRSYDETDSGSDMGEEVAPAAADANVAYEPRVEPFSEFFFERAANALPLLSLSQLAEFACRSRSITGSYDDSDMEESYCEEEDGAASSEAEESYCEEEDDTDCSEERYDDIDRRSTAASSDEEESDDDNDTIDDVCGHCGHVVTSKRPAELDSGEYSVRPAKVLFKNGKAVCIVYDDDDEEQCVENLGPEDGGEVYGHNAELDVEEAPGVSHAAGAESPMRGPAWSRARMAEVLFTARAERERERALAQEEMERRVAARRELDRALARQAAASVEALESALQGWRAATEQVMAEVTGVTRPVVAESDAPPVHVHQGAGQHGARLTTADLIVFVIVFLLVYLSAVYYFGSLL